MKGPVGVLCGGPSREREISLRSGQAVHEALESLNLSSVLVKLSENPEEIPQEIRSAGIGCAFIALHGWFGEDGTVQSLLEQMGIPYTGSAPEACRYAMDKVDSRRRWLAAGLPIPRWRLAEPLNILSRAHGLSFPLVVKPRSEGSSLGISIVDSAKELPAAAEQAAAFGREMTPPPLGASPPGVSLNGAPSRGGGVILEEHLPGPELTVGILEERPLPVIQVVPKRRFYDTTAKYTPGMTEYLVPAPIPEAVARVAQDLAQQAHETLGCRSFSRVDMILHAERGPVLLELNCIPGMTPISLLPKAAAAAGISFPELCRQMLAPALKPAAVGCAP